MATNPLNVINARFEATKIKRGYRLTYTVIRGTLGVTDTPTARFHIDLIDTRVNPKTPIPVSWSYEPSHNLPPFEDVYGKSAKEKRAQRYFKHLGNALGQAFAGKRPFELDSLPRRDFDTIRIYAGRGVSVNPDKQIKDTLPGGNRAAEFSMGMVTGYTPFVEIYRMQSDDRIPELGENINPQMLLASHMYNEHEMHPIFSELAPYISDFDNAVVGLSVDEFLQETNLEETLRAVDLSPSTSWSNHLLNAIDRGQGMSLLRQDNPYLYSQLYLATYFTLTNELLTGDEIKFTPMPWGLRLSHLKTLVNINIRVPVTVQDPYFDRQRRELTLGRSVYKESSYSNANAAFSVHIRNDKLAQRAEKMRWVAVPAVEGGGELTDEEIAEIAASDEAESVSAISGSAHWLMEPGLSEQGDPPIVIVKTPSVNVTVQSPGIAEITANVTNYLTGKRDSSHSKELDHIIGVNIVECREVPNIQQVPQEGMPLESFTIGTKKALEGQRDHAVLLSDELKADLIDAGLRLIPIYGDALDIAEVALGLFYGRDLYGRKVTQEQLLLTSLALIPIVNNGMTKAGIKVPKSLARALNIADKTVSGTGVVIVGKTFYDLWDVVDLSRPPSQTAEFGDDNEAEGFWEIVSDRDYYIDYYWN